MEYFASWRRVRFVSCLLALGGYLLLAPKGAAKVLMVTRGDVAGGG